MREMREETGLAVDVGAFLGEHLFEVVPRRFVRILAYACAAAGPTTVVVSPEHLEMRWVPLADLAGTVGGCRLPAGYLGAIRQATCQPRSSHDRTV
jgi:8-oxo-dGTP pyrophosphatase MutT (NUDIX family)